MRCATRSVHWRSARMDGCSSLTSRWPARCASATPSACGERQKTVVGTRIGAILIGAAAVGLLGAAAFVTDPVSGYPPGTPGAPGEYTTSGALHDLFSIPTFLGLPAAGFVFGHWFRKIGNRRRAIYSTGSAVAMLVFFGLAGAAFNQVAALVSFGGLFQRATVAIDFAWLTGLAIHTLRGMPTE
jgi:hypothetical protein